MLDEVFGEENFIATIVWQKKQSPQNDAINLSDMHDYVVVYAKQSRSNKLDTQGWQRNKLRREASQEARYDNRDEDPRGDWTSADLTCNKTADERPNLYYAVTNPLTQQEVWPNKTRVWAYERPMMETLVKEHRLWWGKDGTNMPRLKVFRTDVDDGVVPSTWWTREFAGDNQDARRELRGIFPEGDVFDTPKPVRLIARILEIATSPNTEDIVLDFFAGSGTVGHAVMNANVADGGKRRFILAQLPEPSTESVFRNLAEVTKERLRRAAKQIRRDYPIVVSDLGFRTFRLDSSNIRAWDPAGQDLAQTLLDSVDHVKQDRSETDVLYELLLKLGLDLCVPIQTRSIAGKDVHAVGGGVLFVCLPALIGHADTEPLAQGIVSWHGELAPAGEVTCVFRDSAFSDDVAKTNLAAILSQNGFQNVRSL